MPKNHLKHVLCFHEVFFEKIKSNYRPTHVKLIRIHVQHELECPKEFLELLQKSWLGF